MTVTVNYSVTLAPAPVTPAPSTPGVADPPERRLYAADILRLVPPWLRRRVGGAVMMSLGGAVDDMADRLAAAAALSFPRVAQADALALIGRDRRIQRGPTEGDATYSARLRPWRQAHRARGGAPALLRQLRAFWPVASHPEIACVAASGLRHRIAADGTITRDVIPWSPGAGGWARLWVLITTTDPMPATPAEEESYRLVPRAWSAAHVLRTTIVVTSPAAWTWGEPGLVWGSPSMTWGAGSSATLTVEG